MEAIELEDTVKNFDCCDSTGWKYISSFRGSRTGTFGSFLDTMEFVWRCILHKQLKKCTAVLLGCMSVAILLAEATILPSGVDLSLFSLLINAVGKHEMLSQIAALIPLMYMCICTYYSLFKIGMLMFYSFTPRQTSSVSLLMICSMVARYAPPISYNFLNLIRLDGDEKTIFEKRMGNIDDAVPFFGEGFNKIYPLIMVIYTALVGGNFFGRVIGFLGSWKRFKFQNEEAADMSGFDSSGIMIIQKERSWLEQGHKIGEQVIPLGRNFNNASLDLECSLSQDKGTREMIVAANLSKEDPKRNLLPQKEKNQSYGREAIANKYAALREKLGRQPSFARSSKEKGVPSTSVSLLNPDNNHNHSDENTVASGFSSKWASLKSGFQNLKANIGAKKFLPLRQIQSTSLHSPTSSSESLDEIFLRIKERPRRDQNGYFSYEDGDGLEIMGSGPGR